jgi:hypothetical protein
MTIDERRMTNCENRFVQSILYLLGFNSPQLAAIKSVQSTFRYLVACREAVY